MLVYNFKKKNWDQISGKFTDHYSPIKIVKKSKTSIAVICRERSTNKIYFVKTLNDQKKFLHEASLHSIISEHKAVATFHGAYMSANTFYIVMEYIEGEILHAFTI